MNSTVPAAFLSYSHFDDANDEQYITKFRELLEREVRAQTGRDFVIFQDRRDIRWGQQWRQRIEQTLDSATFLIPILSPSFFASAECRREVERFLEREKTLDRNDLILPVYYIDSPLLSDAVAAQRDPVARLFHNRQYADWRPLRLKSLRLQTVRQAVVGLAQSIRDALRSGDEPPGKIQSPREPRLQAADWLNQLLPSQFQEVTFRYQVPPQHLPQNVAQNQQAIAVIQYALQREGEDLTQLLNTINQVVPHLRHG